MAINFTHEVQQMAIATSAQIRFLLDIPYVMYSLQNKLPKGWQKRINGGLKDLVMKGMPGNGVENRHIL